MQAIISNSLLKNLSPSERPFEIRDTQLNDLILRVRPSGVRSYYVEYGHGKRLQIVRADALAPALGGGQRACGATAQGDRGV